MLKCPPEIPKSTWRSILGTLGGLSKENGVCPSSINSLLFSRVGRGSAFIDHIHVKGHADGICAGTQVGNRIAAARA